MWHFLAKQMILGYKMVDLPHLFVLRLGGLSVQAVEL
jgi:hypothetical protein